MKTCLAQETYAVFTLEIEKGETDCRSIDDVIEYFKARIEEHPLACLVAVFDHLAHTRGLRQGRVSEDILSARSVVLCFGITLPEARAMAARPRVIGICELPDRFVVTFLEAPMPVANTTMEGWALGLVGPQPTLSPH